MEPIVSPMFFYLLGLLDRVHIAINCLVSMLIVVYVLTIVVSMARMWGWPLMYELSCEQDELYDKHIKGHLIRLVVATLLLPLSVFIPTKETLIQMAVAKQVTGDNITAIVNIGKALKDEVKGDIIDVIEKLN